jgi:hypothetical protein
MAKREIQAGDYFLLPYAGPRRKLLVKAVQFNEVTGHWYVSNEAGMTKQVLLSSCKRVSPSLVARICKAPAGVKGPEHG